MYPQKVDPSAGARVVSEELWVGTQVGPSNRGSLHAGHVGESPVESRQKSWKENKETEERRVRRSVDVSWTMNEFLGVESIPSRVRSTATRNKEGETHRCRPADDLPQPKVSFEIFEGALSLGDAQLLLPEEIGWHDFFHKPFFIVDLEGLATS